MKQNLSLIVVASICLPTFLLALSTPSITSNIPFNLVPPTDNKSYSIFDHPALRALSQNAPRDKQGNVAPIPKMEFNNLNNPLQGRYALLSKNGATFSIVPKASLIVPPSFKFTKEVVLQQIPRATYVDIHKFLNQETSYFVVAHLQPNRMGIYQISIKEEDSLIRCSSDRLILLLDRDHDLPIATLQREIPGNTQNPLYP